MTDLIVLDALLLACRNRFPSPDGLEIVTRLGGLVGDPTVADSVGFPTTVVARSSCVPGLDSRCSSWFTDMTP